MRFALFVAVSFILQFGMDAFGFPYSDDDEEEYTPPKDEGEGEKENDNYVASDSLSDGLDSGAGAGDYPTAGEHIQRCES